MLFVRKSLLLCSFFCSYCICEINHVYEAFDVCEALTMCEIVDVLCERVEVVCKHMLLEVRTFHSI